MATPRFKLDGISVDPPQNWRDLEAEVSFDNSSPMAVVTIDEFIFVNASAELIIGKAFGKNPNVPSEGLFQGSILTCDIEEQGTTIQIAEWLIDYTDPAFRIIHSQKVAVVVQDFNGIERLEDRISAITFDLLVAQGFITDSDYVDIDYVEEELFDALKTAMLFLMIYMTTAQLALVAYNIAQSIALISGIIAAGISGSVGALIAASAMLIVNGVLFALLIIALIDLVNEVFPQLFPLVRTFKGMNFRTMFEKICDKLELTFSSSIPELDNLYLLPTKEQDNRALAPFLSYPNDIGIPRVNDPGYICGDFMNTVRKAFQSKFLTKGSTLHMEPTKNDAFYEKTPSTTLDSILLEDPQIQVNANEMKATTLVSYELDERDDWTRTLKDGTYWEVRVTKPTQSNTKANLLKGLRKVEIPWSLGNRKDSFTNAEETAKDLLTSIDNFVNFLGGSSNLSAILTDKIGLLKVSEQYFSKPKMLYMTPVNGRLKIPTNHKQIIGAEALYNNYISDLSFVANDFRNQYFKITDKEFPFNLGNLVNLTNEGTAILDGSIYKTDSIKYKFSDDKAFISARTRKTFDPKLKEDGRQTI